MICVVAIQTYAYSLPKPNSEFLKKTFRYSGAMQWNHLSEDSKNSETLSSFKRKIYVRHEHLLWIAPIVKFLYNSFSIILCFLVFLYTKFNLYIV
jgi:hypothetical protein